jgi:hypothetical protein
LLITGLVTEELDVEEVLQFVGVWIFVLLACKAFNLPGILLTMTTLVLDGIVSSKLGISFIGGRSKRGAPPLKR